MILVTGGTGFLGGAVIRQLVQRGEKVRTLSRGYPSSLAALGVEIQRGSIENRDVALAGVRGCKAVIHTAAKAGIWGDYNEYYNTNVKGTQNLMNACKKLGVRYFVYTSTPSVVHAGKDLEGVDETSPYADTYDAPYSETKTIAEKLVLEANGKDFLTVALRPHLIWGPGDRNFVPRVLERARMGKLRLVGDGKKWVDSTYIDNAAEAHLLALDRLLAGSGISGKAYFISQGEPIPLVELINGFLDAAGLPHVEKSISPRIAYAVGSCLEWIYSTFNIKSEPVMTKFLASNLSTACWFNISSAKKELGYAPKISIQQGMLNLKKDLATQKS